MVKLTMLKWSKFEVLTLGREPESWFRLSEKDKYGQDRMLL